jgi:integrase/recombinase XerD
VKLQPAVEAYVGLKQSLGFRFATDSRILRAFSKAMGRRNLGQVKAAAVRAHLNGKGLLTRNWERKWVALRGFYAFALARGLVRRSPLPTQTPRIVQSFTPYIYSVEELRRLLGAITPERTPRRISTATFRTLLLLLYGAGLRLSEALRLRDDDVDSRERLLYVRQSKFFKTRLVPVGPKLAKALEDYSGNRPRTRHPNRPFFRSAQGAPLSRAAVERAFRKLCVAVDIKRNGGARSQPRLHDLRHTMATHCLVDGYRKGMDVQSLLPRLSTYLGHVDIGSTQKYLTATSELRDQASARFARYALGGGHE